jgi:hypothetical protein
LKEDKLRTASRINRLKLGTLIAATIVLSVAVLPHTAQGADNELTAKESAAGWKLLFNGQNLAGWKTNTGAPVANDLVADGAFNTYKCGGYLLVYDRPVGDFVLSCDVKMGGPECNSGVFLRVSDLQDPIQTGLEVQIFSDPGATVHDFGAIYDLVAPKRNASKGGGEWDHLEIRCEGPLVSVKVNGELVTELNCDELTEPGKRADGSPHKFNRAIKDFARSGYLGFQDHDHDVWIKNVKLLEL